MVLRGIVQILLIQHAGDDGSRVSSLLFDNRSKVYRSLVIMETVDKGKGELIKPVVSLLPVHIFVTIMCGSSFANGQDSLLGLLSGVCWK